MTFSARYRAELLAIGDQGARAVVNRHTAEIFEVPMDTPHILADMDTPEAYQAAKQQAGEEND